MKSTTLSIVTRTVFGVLILLGFVSLAIYGNLSKKRSDQAAQVERGALVMWGTLPVREVSAVEQYFERLSKRDEGVYTRFQYHEKSKQTFREDLFESIATGNTPNLILADHSTLAELEEVLYTIPHTFLSRASYQARYTEQAHIFEHDTGFVALPFLTDPLVLYYNENLRLKNGVELPKLWSDFKESAYTAVIRRDERGFSITESLIPLGAYSNYAYTPSVLASLLLQTRKQGETVREDDVESILNYYASFANPKNPEYSWNTALPDARRMFVTNRLLFYPAPASEYRDLRRANPNVAIRVEVLPQLAEEGVPATMGTLYGLAVPRATPSSGISFQGLRDSYTLFLEPGGQGQYRTDLGQLFNLLPPLRGYTVPLDGGLAERVFAQSMQIADTFDYAEAEEELLLRSVQDVVTGARPVEKTAIELFSHLEERLRYRS